jgi:acetoin utilization deacetylase AcuC-like enzyme
MADAVYPVYTAPQHVRHDPPRSSDTPARLPILQQALSAQPNAALHESADYGLSPIQAVHTAGLLAFLPTAYARFAELPTGPRPAVPDSFAVRGIANEVPESIWGQLGYYVADSLTPILEGTWDAAYGAAQAAVCGANAVAAGAPLAYALARPPGHHAYADLMGGYCYLNNAAIAAEWLAAQGQRVAVLDTDYHHGNGTQAIFYDRNDVLVVSLHADPTVDFPYFCGHAAERGAGLGLGFNLNVPLPAGTTEPAYLDALDRALDTVSRFDPAVVVLSHGFDTIQGDPEGGFALSADSFGRVGRRVRDLRRPLLVVQEGGYLLESLGEAMIAFWDGICP